MSVDTVPENPSKQRAYQRLTHQPGLDSLRALAVIGVLLYHHDPGRVNGGWLGVSLFFTLSGFLIGSLVLAERSETGGIDLGDFWSRRIRRLVPASIAALGLVFLLVLVSDQWTVGGTVDDIRAAALQFANWHLIGADAPYADVSAVPSPVQHYWSLAIEEQFYFVFPVIIWLTARRRRLLVPIASAVVVFGLYQQLTLGDIDRIYFGTDTRAPELAIGVLLAVALPRLAGVLERRGRFADLLGLGGLVVMAAAFLVVNLSTKSVQTGFLVVIAGVWGALILGVLFGRRTRRLLELAPLPAIGAVSYGIYLYHWPVYLFLNADRTGLDGIPLLGVRLVVTGVLSVASSRLLELPIRRRDVAFAPTVAMAAAMLLVVAGTASVLGVQADDDEVDVAAVIAPPTPVTAPVVVDLGDDDGTPADGDAVSGSDDDGSESNGQTAEPGDDDVETGGPVVDGTPEAPDPPTTTPRRVPRILVTGDSTASAIGTPLQAVAGEIGAAEIYIQSMAGCTLLDYERARIRDGYLYNPTCPDDMAAVIMDAAREYDVDAVVLFLGAPQLMDLELSEPALTGWHNIAEPSVGAAYRTVAQAAMTQLTTLGIPVLWADVPKPEWDMDAFGELFGTKAPGQGPAYTNEPARYQALNRHDDAIASLLPTITRIPYAATLADESGQIPDEARVDGLHLDPVWGAPFARNELIPLLRAQYREARADVPLVAGTSPTTWD